ncbi:MAG: hypothetical protein ACOYWZ_21740 [Bacillota bacterium]
MLRKPIYALCADRSRLSKKHPKSGEPDEWFSNHILQGMDLAGISFDFFVNWRNYSLSDEIWIKRIVRDDVESWPACSREVIQNALYECDGEAYVRRLADFAYKQSKTLFYQLFKESKNWDSNGETLAAVEIAKEGTIERVTYYNLDVIKTRIKDLSGGPVKVGEKGLIYSSSTLECYLSRTDAAWPGDVDLIMVNDRSEPIALLEFKKHTMEGAIENQKLSNYYPRPDGRKYDRLAILRDNLGKELPFIIVYYPTNTNIKNIKLEKIKGNRGRLTADSHRYCNVPTSEKDMLAIVNTVLEMADYLD